MCPGSFAAAVISDLAKGAIIQREKSMSVAADKADGTGDSRGKSVETVEGDRLSVIAAAGGITPLVGLLTTGDAAGKERAASALLHLSIDAVNRDAVAKAGGIPPLVQLLDDTAPQAHEVAIQALARMAHDSPDHQTPIAKKLVALLSTNSEGTQRRSAHMLWELAANNQGAPVRIVNAGAISPLVALMGKGSVEAKDEAVGALSCLAQNDSSNQLAIATGLVHLLGLSPTESQEKLKEVVAQFADATDIRRAINTAINDFRRQRGGEGEGEAGEVVVAADTGQSPSRKSARSKSARKKKSARNLTGDKSERSAVKAEDTELAVELPSLDDATTDPNEKADDGVFDNATGSATGSLGSDGELSPLHNKQKAKTLEVDKVNKKSAGKVSSRSATSSRAGNSKRSTEGGSSKRSTKSSTKSTKVRSGTLAAISE